MAVDGLKALLRLYPRSWRKRYGGEMDALLDELPAEIGVVLDLLIGAANAYASVVRGNRFLSSAASYLHGACVAVLVQAIAFVTLVLVSQQSQATTIVEVGPLYVVAVIRPVPYLFRDLSALVRAQELAESLPAAILLMLLIATLALALAGPRWVRRSIQ
ncbi:MAG TPA: hypothetical protein VIP78_02325 [Candidatus Dormibacteraeota bacterium]